VFDTDFIDGIFIRYFNKLDHSTQPSSTTTIVNDGFGDHVDSVCHRVVLAKAQTEAWLSGFW
jgi:hypothetical protein